MARFYHRLLLCITLFAVEPLLHGCGSPAQTPPPVTPPAAPRELLNHLVERYWDESVSANPWYSWMGAGRAGDAAGDAIAPQALADGLAIQRRYLAAARDVPSATLDAESKLTDDIFRRERELAIEGLTYPSELLPVTPYDSVPQRFAIAATLGEADALSSDKAFEIWRTTAENYVAWTDQAIANMRDGIRRGVTLPRVLVEKMLPQLAALGDDVQANAFYQASRPGSESTGDADRKRRAAALSDEIKSKVLPAYRGLHDFLQREYLPRSRDGVALSSLPLGDAWYAHLVRRSTDGSASPLALHALGLAEVERLHARLQAVLAETAFAGNPQGFYDDIRRDPHASYTSGDELLAAYTALKPQVAEAMQSTFGAMPRADLDVRSTPVYLQTTFSTPFYQPANAYAKSLGVLYVNTASLDGHPVSEIMSQFLRDALPGHHYQLSIQQERSDLARFRRFGGSPAFIEGWGLYAASLGDEMRMPTDAAAKFIALLAQLDCASLMVIDTGMQAKGWPRQQALDFVHAHLPYDDATIVNEVDRTIAAPAAALACTVGYLDIQGLRVRAQQALGDRFDARAFHTELLNDGAIPLDMLDAKMKQWLETAVAAPQDRSSPGGDSS